MRVRHVEQALAGLLGSDLEHKGPFWHAEFDVERLRRLIWNGHGDEARRVRIQRFAQLARELETYLDGPPSSTDGSAWVGYISRPES